ncbi:MAG: MBL fold metallo-hydrolase [Promethearchaeota archaeon]|nr:MAG: MBL fold metallo-hydrolase [Candidatus Lokiarchaeota archaeon]
MRKIFKNVYHLGDSGCSVYLVNTNSKDGLVLIDCGMSLDLIKKTTELGLNPKEIKHCIITHFHIDHTAACADLKEFNSQVKFYAHELDADAIQEKGHDAKTAASWYGINYKPVKLKKKFTKEVEILNLGNYEFQCIHTPGHTPGSISVLIEIDGTKILFGQDIHGPFMKDFGSDLEDYQQSMQKLLDLKADVLCEGHFGIFQPAEKVEKYIKGYMEQNKR